MSTSVLDAPRKRVRRRLGPHTREHQLLAGLDWRTREGKLLSVAGGGDTVSALNHAGVAGDFSYVSTAGGAFLEWMEGQELPGVKALRQSRGV